MVASTRHWILIKIAGMGQYAHDLTANSHTQGKNFKKSLVLMIRELTVCMDSCTAPVGGGTWQELTLKALKRATMALDAETNAVTLRTPARLLSARCVSVHYCLGASCLSHERATCIKNISNPPTSTPIVATFPVQFSFPSLASRQAAPTPVIQGLVQVTMMKVAMTQSRKVLLITWWINSRMAPCLLENSAQTSRKTVREVI